MAIITLTLLASTSAWAKTDKSLDAVINDKFYFSGECDKYLSSVSDQEKQIIFRVMPIIIIEDSLGYVTSKDSVIARLEAPLEAKGIKLNSELKLARESEYGKRDLLDAFEGDEDYSKPLLSEATVEFRKIIKGAKGELKSSLLNYMNCGAIATATGFGQNANYFEQYIDFVKSRPSKAEVGYFEVSANKAYATNKVGTGNQFAEPKQWEGSRFFVVNASFKNLDTESRLPIGGSLFINYNGKDYEFDTVEPIMLEGYNIWFKSINPLITMKTKIVYRIPNEVSGEVFWRPGRNPSDTRLWVGKVASVE
ncbi:hypothetical protein [Pseudomonas sp. S30_BP2TU TE3576]|uniref:hypothetical protein n=1 Tax=Pseudomonas sp. S30_BP2TU TE3576 TaxID=3349329 RepID=UPI003D1B7800